MGANTDESPMDRIDGRRLRLETSSEERSDQLTNYILIKSQDDPWLMTLNDAVRFQPYEESNRMPAAWERRGGTLGRNQD